MKQENVKKRNWKAWGFLPKHLFLKICLKIAEYSTYRSSDLTL